MIGYGRQSISQADRDAVLTVLDSDYLTQGPKNVEFEELVSAYCGAKQAISACNATAALHMAYAALNVEVGDLVWTSPITFVATANAARFLGADIDFVDIDPLTWNLSVERLEEKLRVARKKGRLPKLVVPVHFTGQSCDMERISQLAKEYGFSVVEDAAHAIGGRYHDMPVGSCRYSDITVFSFHPVKVITTGEGGMALTNNPVLAERMRLFVTHGVTRDSTLMQLPADGPWSYEMLSLGWNYRLTDMQAALGISQMTRLDDFVTRRHEIAGRYDQAFADMGLGTPYRAEWQYSAFHLYCIRWPEGLGGLSRLQAFEALRARGIGVNVHYIPVHLQPYYRQFGFAPGDFPQAESYYKEAITLPLHPSLTEAEITHIIQSIGEVAQAV
ncbi:UDP-4-amino-4,6-dideoxy-N-acetyl-beta-L-altrosamine transaminase [Stappia sp. P2PMeth1]|uniref:UDP-4-amino-4, 6-dideoxy-N-acetyl-beta-L-altrosamine transaminase n=1 Tax=Stappia sp. P2PMeth1 TaxID=2003586 RepID=UPI0016485B11|nr:UDP-4-amino-4,6-dideoxy-N-acetyl-beta-L-altrosamine transaminase [Stappia sp. P2PMeth1]